MSKAGLEARSAAVTAMTAVTEEGRPLSEVLAGATDKLDPSEKARAGRLAVNALRWAQRSDRVLGPHLRMKPEDRVLNALRLAIYELFVEGAAPHGVVDGAVSLTAKSKAGLVNGVLRNVLRREIVWDDLPVPQTPKWLRKRLLSAWGKDIVAAMEAVHARPAPLDLTLKDGATAQEWAQKLGAEVLPTGSLRLPAVGRVTGLPGYEEGAWWVQDAGATIAARVLAPDKGARVLDLCAAPGGKTMQMAAAGARVTALDISDARHVRLRENLERTGLEAERVIADALEWEPDAPFDAILVDAPCSATGTLRRHPDLAYARDGSGIDDLLVLQAKLIDRAAGWLRPGGRMVYCTCSLLLEEGEGQVEAAIARRPDLRLLSIDADWLDPLWKAQNGLRLRPDHWADRGGIDGFFVAAFEKRP